MVPPGGTEEQPLELFVGNAGTAARFLAALVCLGKGVYRLHGVPRMHERPQAALFQALRELGYRVESPNDKLPALIHGGRPARGQVPGEHRGEFAVCLGAAAVRGRRRMAGGGVRGERGGVAVRGDDLEADCGVSQERWPVPDRAGCLERQLLLGRGLPALLLGSLADCAESAGTLSGRVHPPASAVSVKSGPASDWQVDAAFPRFLPLPAVISRRTDLGDSIMTAIVLAPFAAKPVRFTDLGRLRVQECERVVALRTELTKCGAKVVEEGDTLTVFPSQLHGAEIETYNDHRMAMCFAILGLKVPGHKTQESGVREEDVPEFLPEAGGAAARRVGGEDSGRQERARAAARPSCLPNEPMNL